MSDGAVRIRTAPGERTSSLPRCRRGASACQLWGADRQPLEAAAQPKELMIVENADHVALYDRMDKVPFDAITDFFAKNLK